MTSEFGDIPLRVVVGVIGTGDQLEQDRLKEEIVKLFDDESQKLLRRAEPTRLELQIDQLTEDTLINADVLLVYRTPTDQSTSIQANDVLSKLLADARALERPIITVTNLVPPAISIEPGTGLSGGFIKALKRFNDYSIPEGVQEGYIENVFKDDFRATDDIPAYTKYIVRRNLLPYYTRASLLAKSSQRLYRKAGLLVYSFSVIAVAAVAVGTLIHSLSFLAYAVEFVLLVSIVITILHANYKRAHKNWIQARYLAERIRAAIFLATCGVRASLIATEGTLGVSREPERWIAMAFNEIINRLPRMNLCCDRSPQTLVKFISDRWLASQITFHTTNAAKARRMNHLLERSGIIVFSAAIMAAGLHLLLSYLHIESFEHGLTFLAIILPATGAALGGIRTHREYSRLAARSSNMAERLKTLKKQLSNVSTPEELQVTLKRIEELSLLEVQEWLMLMSVVKLEAA